MARKLPAVGRRVHERRERDRGHRHGLGGGRHRDPGGDRVHGPGPLAHAGVAGRDHPGPAAAGGAQHGPGPGRLLPGHPGRGPRRLPPSRPRPRRRRRGRGARPTGLPPHGPAGATRSLVFGDYYLAHTAQSVAVEPLDFGPRPETDWALDGSTGGSGRAKLVSFLGSAKQRDDVGYDLSDALRGVRRRATADDGGVGRAHGGVPLHRRRRGRGGGLRHPRQVRQGGGARTCGPEGARVGLVRPDHPVPVPLRRGGRRRPRARAPSPSTRTTRARWSTTSGWRCSVAPRSTSSEG